MTSKQSLQSKENRNSENNGTREKEDRPWPHTHKKKKKMRVAGEQWLNTVCSTEEGSDNRSVLHGNVTALCTLS